MMIIIVIIMGIMVVIGMVVMQARAMVITIVTNKTAGEQDRG